MTNARPVWVRRLYDRVLIYHTWDPSRKNDRTYCGQLMWNAQSNTLIGEFLRTDHADKIGRPCRLCYGKVTP